MAPREKLKSSGIMVISEEMLGRGTGDVLNLEGYAGAESTDRERVDAKGRSAGMSLSGVFGRDDAIERDDLRDNVCMESVSSLSEILPNAKTLIGASSGCAFSYCNTFFRNTAGTGSGISSLAPNTLFFRGLSASDFVVVAVVAVALLSSEHKLLGLEIVVGECSTTTHAPV